jgi:hypothetical protein
VVTIGTQFTIKRSQIPQDVFDAADFEAKAIYESDYASNQSLSGRPRSFDDIRKDTLLGKLGEYFIKSMFNYVEDDEKWHDLISPNGVRTEIKTWRKQYMTVHGTEREIQRLRNRKRAQRQWFFSTEAIVISYDEYTNVFTIEATYKI